MKTYVFNGVEVAPFTREFSLGDEHPCTECCFYDKEDNVIECMKWADTKGHTADQICVVLDWENGNPSEITNFKKV